MLQTRIAERSRVRTLRLLLFVPACLALNAGCGAGPELMPDPPLPEKTVLPWSRAHELRDLAAEESGISHAVFVFFLTRLGPLHEPLPNVYFLSASGGDPSDALIAALGRDPEVEAVFGPGMPSLEKGSRWSRKLMYQGLLIHVTSISLHADRNVASAWGSYHSSGLCCEGFSFTVVRRGEGWVVWESQIDVIL